ncbi:hypothetical protein D3C75_1326630 [compost metagenome]
MAEHQAYIEQRDGEGFTGTGARLDQSAAMQGKVEGVEIQRFHWSLPARLEER